jgi:hypothetical protein
MTIVEKNDVDLSKLFMWSKECELTGVSGKPVKVYIRLLGDADINRARVMSLRKSAEYRKALKDPDSDERIAFIPDAADFDKENLADAIIAYTMRDTTKKAMREVVIPRPKDPGSDATTEQLEKFQAAVDEYPKVREKAIKDIMEKLILARRTELLAKEHAELAKIFDAVIINELCEQELTDRFKEYCIVFGTYADKKFTKRFFNSIEELSELPGDLKIKLMEEYALLEVDAENLKK